MVAVLLEILLGNIFLYVRCLMRQSVAAHHLSCAVFPGLMYRLKTILSFLHHTFQKKIAFVFDSGFRRKARVIKCKPFVVVGFGRQISGGSWSQAFLAECVETGDENAIALGLREQQCDFQNAVFCEENLDKTRRCRWFSERVGPRIILLETCRISEVHTRSHKITNEPFTSSNCENTDKKQIKIMVLRRTTRILKTDQRLVVSRTC